MQNGGGFCHLHHKGRAASRQVVACADTGKDAVNGTDLCACGRHKTADIGQKHNKGDRAHVGGFTAHVGACDHQKSSAGNESAVIWRIAFDRIFHHRMAGAEDFNARCFFQDRTHPIGAGCVMRKRSEHINRSGGCRGFLKRGHKGVSENQKFSVKRLLKGLRALLRRERLVFVFFKFRCDVALGVFKRLLSVIVHGHAVGLSAGNFNEEALHFVVLHAKRRNTGGRAFTRFHFG